MQTLAVFIILLIAILILWRHMAPRSLERSLDAITRRKRQPSGDYRPPSDCSSCSACRLRATKPAGETCISPSTITRKHTSGR